MPDGSKTRQAKPSQRQAQVINYLPILPPKNTVDQFLSTDLLLLAESYPITQKTARSTIFRTKDAAADCCRITNRQR